jgi:hypothetical protein
MINIEVVDLDELNNFGIHHFFSWNHFGSQILVWTYHFWKIQILNVQILLNEEMVNTKVVYLDFTKF